VYTDDLMPRLDRARSCHGAVDAAAHRRENLHRTPLSCLKGSWGCPGWL
jgi:hypothetical protein